MVLMLVRGSILEDARLSATLSHLVAVSAEDLNEFFSEETENLFLIFLRHNCEYSDNLIEVLPEAYEDIMENVGDNFTMRIYYVDQNDDV